MLKRIGWLFLVMCVTVLPSASALAFGAAPEAGIVDVSVDVDWKNRNVEIAGKTEAGAGREVTLLILNPSGEVDFIDQTTSAADGTFMFTYRPSGQWDGIYTVRIGGQGIPIPFQTELHLGEPSVPTWPDGSRLVAVNVGSTTVTLSWTPAVGASGVAWYRLTWDDRSVMVEGTKQSVRIEGLSPGRTYTFTIEAVSPDGKWSTGGPSVTVTTLSGGSGQPQPGNVGSEEPGDQEPGDESRQPDEEDGVTDEDSGIEPAPQDPGYTDTQNHWAKAAIGKLTSWKIMQGYPDGTFKPDHKITRAEFAAVLVRLLDLQPVEGTSVFKDVAATAWYAKYVTALQQAGYVYGYDDDTFRPDREITREEAFVLIWRAVKDRLDVSAHSKTFTDEADISPWAKEAVRALVAAGVIKGYADGSLKPKHTITRAEVAVILAALLQD